MKQIKTEIRSFNPKELTRLSTESGVINAHYMPAHMYNQLVANIVADGELTSVPLVGKMKGKTQMFVISGNHRVAASIDAGLESIDCMVVADPLTEERFIALQLSHNSINGEDDQNILKSLYSSLGIDYKEYSGLTDNDFILDDLTVVTTGGVSPEYVEVVISFLSDEAESVTDYLKTLDRYGKKDCAKLAASYSDFELFFNSIVAIKEHKNITNTAVAFRVMCDLAIQKMLEEQEKQIED